MLILELLYISGGQRTQTPRRCAHFVNTCILVVPTACRNGIIKGTDVELSSLELADADLRGNWHTRIIDIDIFIASSHVLLFLFSGRA